jgi:hypothetical protein
MAIEISELDKLKILWGEDKAISAILTKVDKYCEDLQKQEENLTKEQEERVKKFAASLIDEMHDDGMIDDDKYSSITSSMVSLYPTGAPTKKKSRSSKVRK